VTPIVDDALALARAIGRADRRAPERRRVGPDAPNKKQVGSVLTLPPVRGSNHGTADRRARVPLPLTGLQLPDEVRVEHRRATVGGSLRLQRRLLEDGLRIREQPRLEQVIQLLS